MKPLVSVIIPACEDPRLEPVLYGWSKQVHGWEGTPDTDFELIVINDGESESTRRLALAKDMPWSRYIKYGSLPKKQGQEFRAAKARNAGIKLATGDLCILSDVDIIPTSFLLAAMREAHNGNRILVGIRKHIHIDTVPKITVEDIPKLQRLSYRDDDRLTNLDWRSKFMPLKDSSHGWDFCWSCLLGLPLKPLKEIGGFDESFQSWGAEDVDLAERLVRGKGLKIKAQLNAIGYHLDHLPRDPTPYKGMENLRRVHENWTVVRNGGPIL